MPKSTPANPASLRALPSVDQLLRSPEAMKLRDSVGAQRITRLARAVTDTLRLELQNDEENRPTVERTRKSLLDEAVLRLEKACLTDRLPGADRVINATGVIVHTNLGRAPLSEAARKALAREAAGYCALEYDLTTGARGRRGARVEDLLVELTGAEDALIVNNCAAAAFLILKVLAHDGETIVSRGELVEIGGDFRVPDIMASSGTRMIEVGTTNRTKLHDYQSGLNTKTRLIMRVHPSNYRIIGFTASPSLAELATLAHTVGLPLYEDAGSGVLLDLSAYGLADEPIISASIASGADVVSFSGDKLLGASQAGLIVGRRQIVDRLRRDPIFRALRADKLALTALEKTLESYRSQRAYVEVPVLRMLSLSKTQIEERTSALIQAYQKLNGSTDLKLEIRDGESAIGGGAGPNTHPATVLIAISHDKQTAVEIEEKLRSSTIPIITRIADDRVLIDLRTVDAAEESEILQALVQLSC